MSDPPGPNAPVQRSPGLISRIIAFPFHLFGALCGSLLLSILIECVALHAFWPEQSWHHAQDMFQYELQQTSLHFSRSLIVPAPMRTTQRIISRAHEAILEDTGLLASRASSSPTTGRDPSMTHRGLRRYVGVAYDQLATYALAAAYTCLTFLVRLLVLFLTLPLLLLAAIVGLVDGLVRRDVRRFSSGYESGFVYHRAKASVRTLVLLPGVIYLSLPISVHPLLILLPGAVLLAVAIHLTAATFKKYL